MQSLTLFKTVCERTIQIVSHSLSQQQLSNLSMIFLDMLYPLWLQNATRDGLQNSSPWLKSYNSMALQGDA